MAPLLMTKITKIESDTVWSQIKDAFHGYYVQNVEYEHEQYMIYIIARKEVRAFR